ncbi:MAG: tyrosine-type recombinase/integrase [Ruminococcus sp.]|nr:tyrosine-type recombinase/integrase [Ruminococcus sp.]
MNELFRLMQGEPLKYRLFFTLAVCSGFRRGELLGLEWKDIDWDNRLISVRRTSNYSADLIHIMLLVCVQTSEKSAKLFFTNRRYIRTFFFWRKCRFGIIPRDYSLAQS